MIAWLKRLFGIGVDCRPERYRQQLDHATKRAEILTGFRCKKLKRARFIPRDTEVHSRSLKQSVAILENGNVGDWGPGSIRIAVTRQGQVRNEIIEHEVAHQIAHDNGLGREAHCREFRGKIWNWR